MDDSQPEVRIGVELTPNPHSLKFVTNIFLLESGSVDFKDKSQAQGSLAAEKLFDIEGITGVLVGAHFVTVSKLPDLKWEPLVPQIFERLRSALQMPGPWVKPGLIPAPSEQPPLSETAMRIQEILDNEIRPAVARDGGDVIFEGYENGVVRLHLQGACSSCPSSILTLKMGIESRLKQMVPEIQQVIQV